MNNVHRLKSLLILIPAVLLSITGIFAQNDHQNIARSISAKSAELENVTVTSLFSPTSAPAQEKNEPGNLKAASYLRMETNAVEMLLNKRPALLKLSLPAPGGEMLNLQLQKAKVFTPEFQLFVASNRQQPFDFQAGAFYWGIVEGQPGSLTAITITKEEVSALIHTAGTTFNLGRVADKDQEMHVLYRKEDLENPPVSSCFTDDVEHYFEDTKSNPGGSPNEKAADNCVRMYIEVDYDIYNGKGGVTQAADYVAAVFNQVAIMYANESINFLVNEILVWDVQDPYTGSTTSNYLTQFRNSLNGNYNGDLAHLVGYQGGGGIAYLNVLCNSFYGVGYSDINSTFNNVPAYSWTVEVVTHEIGHNLGSQHTHDCAWNGNNTAIDGCGPAAGYSNGCDGPIPQKGTVMSYCHLVGGVGIDLGLGFGPQPGDRIRSRVYNATCLSACGPAVQYDAGITAVVAPSGTICSGVETPVVELTNFATEPLMDVTIEYWIDGNLQASHAWSGNLAGGASIQVSLPTDITVDPGSYSFEAATSLPNGEADENTFNDAASANFTYAPEQEYFRDADGDGYGDPNNKVVDCNPPQGYVSNNSDCDDTDDTIYLNAPCNDGEYCTTNDVIDANCNCTGTPIEGCDCTASSGEFPSNTLTHSGNGSSDIQYLFEAGSRFVSFTISSLNAILNGNPNNRFEEQVTVTYVDAGGTLQTYGAFGGGAGSSADIYIDEEIQSVTVSLSDGYDGNAPGNLSVELSTIDYCAGEVNCTDTDEDGVCDGVDLCEGHDDRIDTDNDGIPDGCDSDICSSEDIFSANPLSFSIGVSDYSTFNFGSNNPRTGISFTITGLSAQTNGKPDQRYIEEVEVIYFDANETEVVYGIFSGETQSSVEVTIPGAAIGVTVILRDGYDGNPPSELSVGFSEVVFCISSTPELSGTTLGPGAVGIYPNPTRGNAFLRFGQVPEHARVEVHNLLGQQVAAYEVEGTPVLYMDTQQWASHSQVYLVVIHLPDFKPITRRLVIMR